MQLRNGKQLILPVVEKQFVKEPTEVKPQISQKTINDCISCMLNNKIKAFSEVQTKICIGHVDRLNDEIRLLSEMYYIIECFNLQNNPLFTHFMNMVGKKSPEFYRDISVRIAPENSKYKIMTTRDRKAAEHLLTTLRKYM